MEVESATESGDPSFDEDAFIKNYKYGKIMNDVSALMDKLFEAKYGEYIEKKASQKGPTAPRGKGSGSKSTSHQDDWTFDSIAKHHNL